MFSFITMPRLTVLSLAAALLLPLLLQFIRSPKLRSGILILYILAIVWITVGERGYKLLIGTRTPDAVWQMRLQPFWSYAKFSQADIRWQVYMNVFLFIPFGFMLPWCSEQLRKLWKVVLIAAVFSALTEAAQYIFRIGLCETDDVIHNTLGTVIGYGYWRVLSKVFKRDEPEQ